MIQDTISKIQLGSIIYQSGSRNAKKRKRELLLGIINEVHIHGTEDEFDRVVEQFLLKGNYEFSDKEFMDLKKDLLSMTRRHCNPGSYEWIDVAYVHMYHEGGIRRYTLNLPTGTNSPLGSFVDDMVRAVVGLSLSVAVIGIMDYVVTGGPVAREYKKRYGEVLRLADRDNDGLLHPEELLDLRKKMDYWGPLPEYPAAEENRPSLESLEKVIKDSEKK